MPPSPTPSASSRESRSSSLFGSIQHNQSSTFDEYDDDQSDHSSVLDFSKSPSSSHSTSTNTNNSRIVIAASERLAKFEKEQEILFLQKKGAMERELNNVLERNAVKSVSDANATNHTRDFTHQATQ